MIPDDGPFHDVGTTCKFCKKPITIQIADSYDDVADPHKLIPIACCNRCSDLRCEKRSLEAKVKFICKMRSLNKRGAEKNHGRDQMALEKILKQYANLIARWNYMQGMSWDDECITVIMEHPDKWATVLKTLWQIFYDANKNRPEHAGAR